MSKKINLGPVTAYAIAVANGFVGSVQEWLASLKGEKGDRGEKGEPGPQGPQGPEGPKGEQVQPDLTVNDPNDPRYVKGRTHWVEEDGTIHSMSGKYVEGMGWSENVEDEFYSNSALTFAYQEGICLAVVNGSYEIVEGTPFMVIFDGTEYKCTAQNMDGVINFVGNASILYREVDSGEPFFFREYGGNLVICTNKPAGAYPVEIYSTVKKVYPIDKEFFPALTLTVNIDNKGVADKTIDEINEAVTNGCTVELLVTSDDGITFKYTKIGNEFACVDLLTSELHICVCKYSNTTEKWETVGASLDITIT